MLLKKFIFSLLCLALIMFGLSLYFENQVEASFPRLEAPIGKRITVAGTELHLADHPAGPDAELLPMLFIHGASGNLRDLQAPLAEKLEGRGRMIFVDRPGHGYSERGDGEDMQMPWSQAELLAMLLDELDIDKAIVVGHSLGGSTAAAFAVNHPEKVAGLVFLAPATHPWPNRDLSWHYDVANFPVVGGAFSQLFAVPFGQLLYEDGVRSVFKPQPIPEDYIETAGTKLILRRANFQYNAEDVGALYDAVAEIAPRYTEIKVPTSIITGDQDDVVLAEIHSKGLEQDITGSKLVWLKGEGHMPAWTNPDTVIREIERVSAEAKRAN
jgi:pimeloyl-ACP methyl ester carboxylesterase